MSATGTKKIYVIFYTTYGHIYKLVEEVVKGINSVSGIEAVVLQVRIIFTSSRCSGAVVVFCSRYFVSADAFPSSYAIAKGSGALFVCLVVRLVTARSGHYTRLVNLQVPETLPEGVLQKMHAPPKPDVPVADVHDLPNADGFVFAFPTRCKQAPAKPGIALMNCSKFENKKLCAFADMELHLLNSRPSWMQLASCGNLVPLLANP